MSALLVPDKRSSDDHPPLTTRERLGFIFYDFSNSAVASVIISGFLPLLVQDSAQAAAGFPSVCGNVLRNVTALAAAGLSADASAYVLVLTADGLWPSNSCVAWPLLGPRAVACPGMPPNADSCMAADGLTRQSLCALVGSMCWEPAAYTNMLSSVSTGLSMLAFVQISSLADHSSLRKILLVGISYFGAALCMACAAVGPATWQLGGLLMVATTLCYAVTYVLYNAYLPLLAANDPLVLAAPPDDRDATFMRRMDALSSAGFGWGYVGGVACLTLCLAVTAAWRGDSLTAFGINCVIAGAWWATFSSFTAAWLKPRPGPPLPSGGFVSTLAMPWLRLGTAFRRARELPQTFTFLVAWFVYSDGMNVISSVGAIYANTSVNWLDVNKALGLAGMLLIPSVFAAGGSYAFQLAATGGLLTPMQVINTCLITMALVPAYGLLGFISPVLGYRYYYELYAGVALYGFTVGALQSFSRSAFAAMVPEGQEDLFFALYNVTDRGSSWIGPAVISLILQTTGSIRAAFLYPVFCLLAPLAIHIRLNFSNGESDAKAYASRHGTAQRASRGAMSVFADATVGDGVGGDSGAAQSSDKSEKAPFAAAFATRPGLPPATPPGLQAPIFAAPGSDTGSGAGHRTALVPFI